MSYSRTGVESNGNGTLSVVEYNVNGPLSLSNGHTSRSNLRHTYNKKRSPSNPDSALSRINGNDVDSQPYEKKQIPSGKILGSPKNRNSRGSPPNRNSLRSPSDITSLGNSLGSPPDRNGLGSPPNISNLGSHPDRNSELSPPPGDLSSSSCERTEPDTQDSDEVNI